MKIYNYFKNIFEENVSQESRLKSIYEKRNSFTEVIEVIKLFLILASTSAGWVSVPAFASLVGIPMGITSSAIWLKTCAMTAGIKSGKVKRKLRVQIHELRVQIYKLRV